MTYRTYKITSRSTNSGWIRFYLDGYVDFEDGSKNFIDCKDSYPFSSYYSDNYLEIDVDRTKYYGSGKTFEDTSIVRKYDASGALTPFQRNSSLSVSSRFQSAVVSAHQSGSDFEAYVEEYDSKGSVINYQELQKRNGRLFGSGSSRK